MASGCATCEPGWSTVRGLAPGASVEVRGYAPDSNCFVAPVEIVLQLSLFPAAGPHPHTAAKGLRRGRYAGAARLQAQVPDTQLLGGDAIARR